MARRKQVAPMQRINSGEVMQPLPERAEQQAVYMNGHSKKIHRPHAPKSSSSSGVVQLLICIGGIYASFLTWGLLQERITTTAFETMPSGLQPTTAQEYFRFPIFLNTVQSLFAFVSGSLYLTTTATTHDILPSKAAFLPLLLIAITQTLASPFGYASLAHVDYLTFVLAKSCKLLPVMFLHVTFYRRRYPLSKYLIVAAVTAGVAVFTLYHPPKPGKSPRNPAKSSYYGLSLLAINLLFDGLTNTTQDHIFSSPARYGHVTSSQMMAITNFYATGMMAVYLLVTPHLPHQLLPAFAQSSNIHELSSALSFLQRHPSVLYDVLGFALCGAIGQLFIFATLERFSSLLLVTVTVTRKMLTMVLSVVWYGKSLTQGQWAGVGLVFGGIGTEAYISAQEKKAKQKAKAITKKAE
jgi:solute carrier family 35 (UDP-galactose transporter), member B1